MLLINKSLLLKLTLLFILTISHTVFAATLPTEIPPYINYQGTLTRLSDGTAANERLNMTFSIYAVPEGGEALYAQSKAVVLNNGQFGVAIGEGEGWYGEEKIEEGIPVEVFADTNQLYIGIRIEGHQEMFPRSRILSVAFAYKAKIAKRADEADIAEKAKTADEAERAKFATEAEKAEVADLAEKAKTAENIMGSVSITPSGDVAINPTEKLEVTGKVAAVSFEGNGSSLRGIYCLDTSDGKISNVVYVDSNSNVSIGTSSPGSKLSVAGEIAIGSNYAGASGPSNGMIIEGNVGIGITTPEARLHVTGSSIFTEPITVNTVYNPTVPRGGIIMYSGSWSFDTTGLGTGMLEGWALCNGNNGTPNLSDRFVMGTVTSPTPGTTGGANSYSLAVAQLPSHNHTASTSLHGMTKPARFPEPVLISVNCCTDFGVPYNDRGLCNNRPYTYSPYATTSIGHTGSGTSIDNRPSFIHLAFIMKI